MILWQITIENYREKGVYIMSERKQIHQEFLTGERALFASNDLDIYDTIFDDGESPLK